MLWAMMRGMLRDLYRTRLCDRVPAAALLALALLLPGCTGSSVGVGAPATPAPSTTAAAPPPSSPSLGDKIETFFTGAPKQPPAGGATAQRQQQTNIDCPFIDIREGASTLTIPPPPPDGGNEAMALKYQGTFVRAARDCKLVGNQVTMRLGVEGRIIVGPAGGPGQVEVPLRIAVIDNPTLGGKMVVTKLIRIPVTIGPSNGTATFTHVEDNLTFPLPPAHEIDRYIVYIGFDLIGAEAEDRAKLKPAAKIKPKPKPKGNPSTPTG
jgi:hypothetical protein